MRLDSLRFNVYFVLLLSLKSSFRVVTSDRLTWQRAVIDSLRVNNKMSPHCLVRLMKGTWTAIDRSQQAHIHTHTHAYKYTDTGIERARARARTHTHTNPYARWEKYIQRQTDTHTQIHTWTQKYTCFQIYLFLLMFISVRLLLHICILINIVFFVYYILSVYLSDTCW